MLRWIDDRFEAFILAATMGAMIVLIFSQVVMRYALENSLVWSEELVRWLFIWTIWIGIAYAFKTGQHIRITTFTSSLSRSAQHRLNVVLQVGMIAFFLWIGWLGFQQATSHIVARQSSVVMHWPFTEAKISLTWLYATLPFGSLLSVYRLAQRLWRGTPLSEYEI